ncbi:ComF family protein [Streptomyces ovatisporus]|uniref:ComF family protein n=1 Tax=Streptomyces ovatisporus TaxID=1128682 RepID=A0ABV9ACV4_9ACTN
MGEWWRELGDELAGLVLPSACAGCGLPRVREELCRTCGNALRRAVPRRVDPRPAPPGLPRVYAALPYTGEVRTVLLAHKERGALRLAAPLGRLLAAVVRTAYARTRGPSGAAAGTRPLPGAGSRAGASGSPGAPLTLVPVPSARRTVAGRGHDPVRRMALAAARELRRAGVPARVLAVLRHGRAVADQAGLTARQRLANLDGALEMVPDGERLLWEGETVLVDDLMTTGASLAEAGRAVRIRGPEVTAAAVVAFRPRPGGGQHSDVADS